jgi:CrcB protein
VSQPTTTPTHRRAGPLALVAVGGIAGAPARYAISQGLPSGTHAFPTATFATNLTGALLLGFLLEALARRGPDEGRRRSARLLLGTGFCGAYTTYSTFAVDVDQLLRAGRVGVAIAYALGTVVLGLGATFTGVAVAAAHHRRIRVMDDPDLSRGPSGGGDRQK